MLSRASDLVYDRSRRSAAVQTIRESSIPRGVIRCGSQPSSESRSDQLRDAVAPEDDGSEASCDDGEKKRSGYGVFHGAVLSTKDAPAIRSQPVH
jgi:hypothetical protein